MTRNRLVSLALAAVLAPAALAAQTVPDPRGDTSAFRPLGELPSTNQYRGASGAPGPRYWQQRADYRIAATLDTAQKFIRGSETIRYRNNSPDSLRYVWLQVDQNLYRPGSIGSYLNPADSRWGVGGFQGGIDVADARVN